MFEIIETNTPRTAGQPVSPSGGCPLHTRIGTLSGMSAIRARRIDLKPIALSGTFDHGLHHAFSRRRTTNIAQTNK